MFTRTRRLRKNHNLRALVRETRLHLDQLIYPLFIDETLESEARPIGSMPGISRHSLTSLRQELTELQALGVKHLLLFGIPKEKDGVATQAHAENGIVQQSLRMIRSEFGQSFTLITDVCNCEYTDHGHCGILHETPYGTDVHNDKTLELLAQSAISHAQNGADIIAPSDMMDGRIAYLRQALDEAGYSDIPIMSYSTKFASSYYGPFREAADSSPQFGDRRSYQMDPANGREALRESLIDLEEGADILMVKPALAYLDVVKNIADHSDVPLAVYNVSGEFSMIKAAAAAGYIDGVKVTLETLNSFCRAGADLIISYHTREVAQWLQDGVIEL